MIGKQRILIIEGPAGSGKTTVAEYLTLHPDIELVKSSLPNRDPMAYSAIIDSSSNDYSKLSKAMYSRCPGIVIDRLFLSQIVYHALRSNTPPSVWGELHLLEELELITVKDLITLWQKTMISAITIDLGLRAWNFSKFSPKLKWLILLPSESDIVERRRLTHCEYRWEPLEELNHYEELIHAKSFFSGVINESLNIATGIDSPDLMNYYTNWLTFDEENKHGDGCFCEVCLSQDEDLVA